MSEIFISYVEEDGQFVANLVRELETELESESISCWYYQRDGLPGPSYLLQVGKAIEDSRAVILVLSPAALDSFQVDKEISFAHEFNKPFVPLLRDVSWGEFQQKRPAWRMAVGTATALKAPGEDPADIIHRLIGGLAILGIGSVGSGPTPVPGMSPVTRVGPALQEVPIGPLDSSPTTSWSRDHSTFVGRTSAMKFLLDEYEAVVEGQGGRLVFISGDAGVGKTRLAQELGLHAWRSGGAFLEATYAREGTAYGPWVDLLRAGLRGLHWNEVLSLIEPYGADLAQILPELAQSPIPLPALPALPAEEQRRRLFDGITSVILNVSKRSPLVLLVNDLQWSSDLTLLSHLASRVGEARVLVVATYRSQELAEEPQLVRALAALDRARLMKEIHLDPLSQDETAELVATRLGARPAEQLRDPVYKQTHGNAFFVEEVLRSLIETGSVRGGASGWEVIDASRISIPSSIKLVIEDRVDRLGSAARHILMVAALLGHEFSFSVLKQVSGEIEGTLIDVVEKAVAAHILLDCSVMGEERFAFADDQISEILYEVLSGPRRRRYHLKAGEVLEERYSQPDASQLQELARHFLEGNELVKGAAYAYRAGEANQQIHDWTLAATWYARAAEAYSHLPDTVDVRQRRIDALVKQVSVSFNLEDPKSNFARLAEAESLARALAPPDGDALRLARIHYWTGYIHQMRNDYPEALAHYQQVLERIPSLGEIGASDHQLLARPANAIGQVLISQGKFGQGTSLISQAIEPLRKSGDVVELIFALDFLGLGVALGGDHPTGLAHVEHAIALAEQEKNTMALGTSYGFRGLLNILAEDPESALLAYHRAIEALEQVDARVFVCANYCYLAWAESQRGNDQGALEHLGKYHAMLEELGGRIVSLALLTVGTAEIHRAGGRIEEACRAAEKAIGIANAGGETWPEGRGHRVWADALLQYSPPRWEEAEEHLATSLKIFETSQAHLETAYTELVWGEVFRKRGDNAAAREHLAAAAARFAAAGLTRQLERAQASIAELET
jgi:tetratricopeptide (TPR) repeat protein